MGPAAPCDQAAVAARKRGEHTHTHTLCEPEDLCAVSTSPRSIGIVILCVGKASQRRAEQRRAELKATAEASSPPRSSSSWLIDWLSASLSASRLDTTSKPATASWLAGWLAQAPEMCRRCGLCREMQAALPAKVSTAPVNGNSCKGAHASRPPPQNKRPMR